MFVKRDRMLRIEKPELISGCGSGYEQSGCELVEETRVSK